MEEVVIEVSADGHDVKVEGHGFQGDTCQAVTKAIEQALGTVTRVVKKPEYHRQRTVGRKVGR